MPSLPARPVAQTIAATGAALSTVALGAGPAFAAAVPDVWTTYDPSWCSGPCSGHPYTVDDEADVDAGAQITIDVLANDYAQQQVIPSRMAAAAGGDLTVLGVGNVYGYDSTFAALPDVGDFDIVDNTVHYRAPQLPAGVDGATVSFVYVAQDRDGDRTPGHGTIRIHPAQVTVTANDDAARVPFETATTIEVLTNDSASDDSTVALSSSTTPTHGAVEVVGNALRYTPQPGYIGADQFTYTAQAGTAQPATATVRIDVQAPGAPITTDDSARVAYEGALDVDVLTNDTSFDRSPLTLTSVGTPQHGTASVVDGTIRYTAPKGYAGPDTVTYTVIDRTGATSTAQLTITVDVPAGPRTSPDTVKLNAGPHGAAVRVLLNDSSPVGSPLRLTGVTDGQHGTVTIDADTVVYTPRDGYTGSDEFTYTVIDEFGTTAVGTVEVSVVGAAVPPAVDTPAGLAATLPVTGAEGGLLATLGAALVGAGAVLVQGARPAQPRARHARRVSARTPTLSVALMVRNEAQTLPRALRSVRDVADEWVVLDTGSTDDTLSVLADASAGWTGALHHASWVDFSTGRNHLAQLVRTDWVLYLDADHELIDAGNLRRELERPVDAYRLASLEQPVYLNPRLVRAGLGTWRGRTHEALHLPANARVTVSSARVAHHGDGGSRADKLHRDATLLAADLADRDEVRTRFYLGSTLLGLGNLAGAREHLRIAQERATGEEQYVAAMTLARVDLAAGDLPAAAAQFETAARMRPGRFEAPFEAVRLLNRLGRPTHAAHLGLGALRAPARTREVLFVHTHARVLLTLETAHALLGSGDRAAGRRLLSTLEPSQLPPGLLGVLTALQAAAQ